MLATFGCLLLLTEPLRRQSVNHHERSPSEHQKLRGQLQPLIKQGDKIFENHTQHIIPALMRPVEFSHIFSGVTLVARKARADNYHAEATSLLLFINDVVTPPKPPEILGDRNAKRKLEPSKLVQLGDNPSSAARRKAMQTWLSQHKALTLRLMETNKFVRTSGRLAVTHPLI